ncbi:MAG: YihY/virulence factor BrkB family protein [Deltaproteobacteria bacterium]|nr:YihY/virulence factor BrkB family protein [Deltaproteobacteria bacterium]
MTMGIARELVNSYKDHDCLSLAANISFFSILSLIPFLMITMSVAGFVLGSSQELFGLIISTVTDVLPQGKDELAANLNKIISGRTKVGGAGVVFLFLIASLLFSSIEHALDRIFQSVKKRNYFHSKIISILLVFGMISFLFLPTVVRLSQTALATVDIQIPLGSIATSKIFIIMMMIASFVLAVMIVPSHDVKLRFAAIGGVFFAVGIAVAKFIFRWYIANSFGRYNLIYGSLAVMVISILWIYYLSNVFLIASELVAVLQRRYLCQNNGASGSRG